MKDFKTFNENWKWDLEINKPKGRKRKQHKGIQVIESRFSSPSNAKAGWYVVIMGSRDDISANGLNLAQDEADLNGYDPNVVEKGGIVRQTRQAFEDKVKVYTKAYWFYNKK